MKSYDETRCRQLLEAYYQGIILPEEQAELRNLLNSSDLPVDLDIEHSFFAMLDEAAQSESADLEKFDAIASEMVAGFAAEERLARWSKLRRVGGWTAAAAIAVVLAICAVVRFDSLPVEETPLVAVNEQSVMEIKPDITLMDAEPQKEMVAVVEERSENHHESVTPAASVVAAPVVAASVSTDTVSDGVTDEELRQANQAIDEVQAFFNELMAEWDNADRGVRGLLKKAGTLADSGEIDPEIIENQ